MNHNLPGCTQSEMYRLASDHFTQNDQSSTRLSPNVTTSTTVDFPGEVQAHVRTTCCLRYSSKVQGLQEQHDGLLSCKQYERARTVGRTLQLQKAAQRQQCVSEHASRFQNALRYMHRQHAQEVHVLKQKQEDETYKLLRARQQESDLAVRQRNTGACKLARGHRKARSRLQVCFDHILFVL